MPAIRTRGLSKTFPGQYRIPGVRDSSPPQKAVYDLDLTVEQGEVFGFLGPNGAGKSTTINILLDYVRPTEGSAAVLGMDAQEETKAIHDHVGVLPEDFELWGRLPARKHVRLAAETKDVDVDPGEILERVGLRDAADRPVGGFSTGMAQRLTLGMALVGEPDLLILDEPTAGLDPNGVRRLRAIVEEEVDRGATVFFSSHVLEQVESVCDRVGILRNGELVTVDTIEGLREDLGSGETLTVDLGTEADEVVAAVEAVDGATEVRQRGRTITATCFSGRAKVDAVAALLETDATIRDFDVESTDLESLFATYAGDGTDESSEHREREENGPADGVGDDAALEVDT